MTTPNSAPGAIVLPDILTPAQQSTLLASAIEYRRSGVLEANPSGPNRYRARLFDSKHCTPLMLQLGHEIALLLGVEKYPIDPYLGWILSYVEPGGFIKTHIDAQPRYQNSAEKHLRCNLLVQGADLSARPIIEQQVIPVEERGLWAFFASEYSHGTAVLEGEAPRVVMQYGFSVPRNYQLPALPARIS